MSKATKQDLPMLIFDGDCGFCTSTVRLAERMLPAGFRAVPWQRVPDLSAYGLSPETAAASVQWVDESGRASAGHLAFARMLVASGGMWRPVGRAMTAPPVDRAAAAIYDFIARNRHRLPGGTPACQLPEE